MHKLAVLALYLFAGLIPLSISGQPVFIPIGTEQGLTSLQITDIYQDRYGFVWIGTPYGLNRFDGYDCVQFYNLPGDTLSISSNHISPRAFWEDPNGNLWVATYTGGLNCFDRDKEQFVRFRADEKRPNRISMDKLFAIEPDGKGGLWIATAGRGFNHFDLIDTFKTWKEDEGKPGLLMGSTITGRLKRDKQGQLWIGTNKGVCRFDPERKSFEYFPFAAGHDKSLSDGFVTDIYEDKKGDIWLGTANGLNRWEADKKRFEKYYFSNRFPNKNKNYDYILDMLEGEDGKLWLGTNAGLLLYDVENNDCERFLHDADNPFSIKEGPVNIVVKDRENNIWLGTNNGISILNTSAGKFNHPVFQPIRESFGQITEAEGINAVLEVDEALWFATQKGIYRYLFRGAPQLIMPGNFTALFYDKNTAEIYAGFLGNGFYILDARHFTQKKHYAKSQIGEGDDPFTVKGHRLTSFARDRQGFVWIAADGCLNRFNPATGRFRKFHNDEKKLQNPSTNTNLHLLTDRKGNLWIASMGGLSRLSQAELSKPFDHPVLFFEHFLHHPGKRTSISSDVVTCLLESTDGHLWIGTDAGLNRYNPESGDWQWYFKADGLPGNEISALVEDPQGNIWIGGAHEGLSKYDQTSGVFFHFSKKDGLPTDRFRPNAGLFFSTGLVIMGGRTGLAGFQPHVLMQEKKQAKPFFFTDFKILNQSISINNKDAVLTVPIYKTDQLELRFDQKILTFQFSALNFINPEKQIYRYRLVPFQRNWQYIGSKREITFTNLDPGSYQLSVETSEDGYDWNGKTIALRIRPHWSRTWGAYLLYIITAGAALLFIRRYELRRQRTKAEAIRLQELDLAKNRLYANITHEFRTPLTLILGMEEQVRKDPGNWLDEGLRLIQRNGQLLLKLVNQMLDLSKLESGHLPVKMIRSDIVAYLHYLTESFHSYTDSKDILLTFHADFSDEDVDYDPEKLQHIMSNLLSNAIKFTPAGGEIEVAVHKAGPEIVIRVTDTGPGIPPEHLPHIFDLFYQVEDTGSRYDGSGIGLALVKELVRLLGGSISVESPPGKGAGFCVQLPISRGASPASMPLPSSPVEAFATPQPELQVPLPGERDTVLLVEDNADVMTYLSAVLAESYQVLTARNGQEGFDKALEYIPDIIVSDVMMPVKTGFELCKALKSDDRSSHIPIVLLTAKADHEAKIAGLTYGADVYLSKPFNQEELLLQLKKLVALRRQLQERYQASWQQQPENFITPLSLNDRFLQKTMQLIESNISDEDFDMPKLCALLNMSRSNLFRKIKALTGESATGFIRSVRLNKARELLLNTDMNVTEVCFATGFSSPNYFSRVFQEVFGMAPSEVRRR